MKKIFKTLIIAFIICLTFIGGIVPSKICMAAGLDPNTFTIGQQGIDDDDKKIVKDYSNTIANTLFWVSVIIAVIALMVVGILYITTGSLEGKAEYKKNLIPIVLGIFIIAFLSSIITFFIKIGESI